MRFPGILAGLFLAFAAASRLQAQAPSLRPGDHVRGLINGRTTFQGRVEKVPPGRLVLRSDATGMLLVLDDTALSGLEMRRASGRSFSRGLAIGFGIGAGLGLALGIDAKNTGFSEEGTGDIFAIGAVVGGIGAATGLIIGGFIPRHTWSPVSPPRNRITPITSSIRGSPALGLRVAF